MAFIHFVKFKLGDVPCFSKSKAYFSEIRYIKSQKCIQSFPKLPSSSESPVSKQQARFFMWFLAAQAILWQECSRPAEPWGKYPEDEKTKIESCGSKLPLVSSLSHRLWQSNPSLIQVSGGVHVSGCSVVRNWYVEADAGDRLFLCVSRALCGPVKSWAPSQDWPEGSLAVGTGGMWLSLSPAYPPVLFKRGTPMPWEREFTTVRSAVFTPALSSSWGVHLGC